MGWLLTKVVLLGMKNWQFKGSRDWVGSSYEEQGEHGQPGKVNRKRGALDILMSGYPCNVQVEPLSKTEWS